MSATTPECADPVSGDESSAQQVRLLVCQLQRCSRRALFCLGAEPHWRTWAACAGAWASLSACTSRRATCSSPSVAGCTWQLSRGCAQILKPCPHIGSHALPGACSCALAPVRRQPASVSPAGVLLARSYLSQPLPSCADWPRATHEAAPCHVNEWSVWRVVACRDSVSCYVISRKKSVYEGESHRGGRRTLSGLCSL